MKNVLPIILAIYSLVITIKYFIIKSFFKRWINILIDNGLENWIPNNVEIKKIITTIYSDDDK